MQALHSREFSPQIPSKFMTHHQPDILIVEGPNRPFIKFSTYHKTFHVSGESFMANARLFYQPLFNQVYSELLDSGRITVEFNFSAFCPRSLKMLFEFMGNLRYFKKVGKDVHIIWRTNDEPELQELGEAISELFDLDILLKY